MRIAKTNIVSLRGAIATKQSKKRLLRSFHSLAMTPLAILFATLSYFTLPQAYADDWPQVQHDPQHTGYSAETLGTNFRVAWTYPFQPDRVYPQTQAIIYQGKVFVGTEGANGQAPSLYAIDAINPERPRDQWGPGRGRVLWKFTADGPILNSAAADNNMVFFATLNGSVYGVDMDGTEVWKNQLSVDRGFTTAPIIADNKVLIGGQDGKFYALNPADGTILWNYEAGAPILQTAAYNNSRVYFGAHDMSIYALNTTDGGLVWKSNKLKGIAIKDYWPVVHQGRVLIKLWSDTDDFRYSTNFYALDETTGVIDSQLPQYDGNTMNGTATPPCINRDARLVIPHTEGDLWAAGGWALFDLSTKNVEPLRMETPGTSRNPDETLNVSCANNLILVFHTQEFNANITGFYDLNTQTWVERQNYRNAQMNVNTQGGGGNPPSISNGMVYHISIHELIVRTTN